MTEENQQLHIEFYSDTRENKAKSAEAGRAIHEDIEMVRIRWAGDKNQSLVAPAQGFGSARNPETNLRMTYAEQFPRHYEAFKANKAVVADGTPLEELPFITNAKREDLKSLNIYTAEALASLDGSLLGKLGMGGRDLKNRAEDWIEKAAGVAVENRLSQENTALQNQITELKAEMAKLQSGEESPMKSASPFDNWDDADIKNWLKDQGGEIPRGAATHETLVARADALNAKIAKAKEAA